VGQVHAHDGVARLENSKVGCHVGLGAAVRLHIHMLCTKELLAALARQLLGHVHEGCAPIVAFAWVALRIFVGHDTALGLHDRSTCIVLGCNQNDGISLPLQLGMDGGCDLGIFNAQGFQSNHRHNQRDWWRCNEEGKIDYGEGVKWKWMLKRAKTIADFQFGPGAGEALFSTDTAFSLSKTGRLRYLFSGEERIATVRASDGLLTLSMLGAKRLHARFPAPSLRVVASDDAAPFRGQGRQCLC